MSSVVEEDKEITSADKFDIIAHVFSVVVFLGAIFLVMMDHPDLAWGALLVLGGAWAGYRMIMEYRIYKDLKKLQNEIKEMNNERCN